MTTFRKSKPQDQTDQPTSDTESSDIGYKVRMFRMLQERHKSKKKEEEMPQDDHIELKKNQIELKNVFFNSA